MTLRSEIDAAIGRIKKFGLKPEVSIASIACSCYDQATREIKISKFVGKRNPLIFRSVQHHVLHEIGHWFLHRNKGWCKTKGFKKTFGDVDKRYWESGWIWRRFCRYDKESYLRAYSAHHPWEDFCDIFAEVVMNNGYTDGYPAPISEKMSFVWRKLLRTW